MSRTLSICITLVVLLVANFSSLQPLEAQLFRGRNFNNNRNCPSQGNQQMVLRQSSSRYAQPAARLYYLQPNSNIQLYRTGQVLVYPGQYSPRCNPNLQRSTAQQQIQPAYVQPGALQPAAAQPTQPTEGGFDELFDKATEVGNVQPATFDAPIPQATQINATSIGEEIPSLNPPEESTLPATDSGQKSVLDQGN